MSAIEDMHMTVIRSASDLGAAIRERRRGMGWTQAQLAARIGTSRVWVNEVENGKPRAQLALVLQTLAELGLEIRLGYPAELTETPDLNVILDMARQP